MMPPPSDAGKKFIEAVLNRTEGLMYRLADGVRSTHGPDHGVVLDIGRGQMLGLNFVGSRILELLKDGLRQQEIVDRIGIELGVGTETADHDIGEFLTTLKQHGVIEERCG
jgi:hypothetical protein